MKQKKIWKYCVSVLLTAFLAIMAVPSLVRAEETTVREIGSGVQLVKELSKSWEDIDIEEVSGSRCQTKQIIVFAGQMDDFCGAQKVLHYDGINTYYLQYDTEEETWEAYKKLRKQYGSDCMLDEIVEAEDWQLSTSSWGSEYTGLDRLKATPAVASLGGSATVAVVDTGINTSHSLFTGRRLSSASRNIFDDNGDISDVSGHGTHVAGIVADCTPAQVEILSVKVYGMVNGKAVTNVSKVQAGILYAVQKGADVINLSLGDTNHVENDNWLEPCITAAWEKGIPIICAAGNSKKNVSTCYPACDTKTIAVSAIDRSGYFAQTFSGKEGSNYGTGIDFAAPGVSIASASVRNNYELELRSGTSMAAPFVSAAAAYVKLALPQSSVNQVKNILKSYAVDYGVSGKDEYYGYGVIYMENLQIGLSGNVVLTLKEPSMVFSGSPCCPGVLVSNIPSGQYTVFYANNTRPGTGTVTVTGTGVYTGSVSANFSISLGTPVLSSVECAAKGTQICWNSLPGADSYILYRRKNNGSWSQIKSLKGSAVSYTDTGVSSGTTYEYRLRAAGSGVTSAYSTARKIVFVKSASLTSVTNGDKGITLKWKKVSGISGYYVYRKTASQTAWKYVKQVSASTVSYTDTKVIQGEKYSYQIRPYKKISGKKYKGAAANTKSIIYMKKMAAPTLKNVKTKSLQVRWKTAAGIDGYQIRWSLKKSMSSAKNMKITSPRRMTATLSGLKKGKTYYVQIRSMKYVANNTVYGAWSIRKSVKIRK